MYYIPLSFFSVYFLCFFEPLPPVSDTSHLAALCRVRSPFIISDVTGTCVLITRLHTRHWGSVHGTFEDKKNILKLEVHTFCCRFWLQSVDMNLLGWFWWYSWPNLAFTMSQEFPTVSVDIINLIFCTKHRQTSLLSLCTPRPLSFDKKKTCPRRSRDKTKEAAGNRWVSWKTWRCFVHLYPLPVTHETLLKILCTINGAL